MRLDEYEIASAEIPDDIHRAQLDYQVEILNYFQKNPTLYLPFIHPMTQNLGPKPEGPVLNATFTIEMLRFFEQRPILYHEIVRLGPKHEEKYHFKPTKEQMDQFKRPFEELERLKEQEQQRKLLDEELELLHRFTPSAELEVLQWMIHHPLVFQPHTHHHNNEERDEIKVSHIFPVHHHGRPPVNPHKHHAEEVEA